VRPFYPNSDVINLILNGADYRCSGEVKEAARTLNIKLYYLPPYSPNLSPIEWLWKVMNEQARNKEYFATTKEF
jgi:transposase